MKGLSLGLLLWLCLVFSGSEAAIPRMVRVNLFQAYRPLHQVKLIGPLRIIQPINQTLGRGTYIARVSQGQVVIGANSNSRRQAGTILIKTRHLVLVPNSATGIEVQPVGLRARRYVGQLALSVEQHNTLRVVNEIPAQDYVTLVVGSETPPGWPMEALKAQAVLTQTRLARYRSGDAVSDTTQGEAFLGDSHRRPEVSRAVTQVWGQILMTQDLPLTAFYHASCAGHTSDTRVFGNRQRLPGIMGVPCTACRTAIFAKPTSKVISGSVYNHAFPEGLPQVLSRDEAGRPLSVRFANGKIESGYLFWLALGQKLGWDKAPGLRFSWQKDSNGRILITSSGAGHGVGLCQHGAAKMARQGKTYRQILNYYFLNAQLSP